MTEMRIHADRTRNAVSHGGALPWLPSPVPGIERRMLERIGGEIALATSIVRYAPKSHFPPHAHELGEEYIVLEGTFADEHGTYPVGTYVRNPPGSRHAPYTEGGCTILVKLRQMPPENRDRICVHIHDHAWNATEYSGRQRLSLYQSPNEQVCMQRFTAECQIATVACVGGEELFVMQGRIVLSDGSVLDTWGWLRRPAQSGGFTALASTVLWVKQGHL